LILPRIHLLQSDERRADTNSDNQGGAVRRLRSTDDGFTLLEVMTTCLLLGLLLAIAAGPWRQYAAAKDHKGAQRQLVSVLRHAQVASVSEARTYRVDISTSNVKEFAGNGASWVLKRTEHVPSANVTYSGGSFVDKDGVTSTTSVYFYPRGSASRGSVDVVRAGSSKIYSVSVEGLTARVSYTD
jgi:prepilin-type N-terminal cleavage/methylation domain-containing protein